MRQRLVRAGLAYLALGAASVGVWATPAPRSWFDDFPGGPAGEWAAALPPYNEHLVRDVGALYLGFTVLFAWALWRPARSLVVPLAVAWIVAQVPHLVFHVLTDDRLSSGDRLLQNGALIAFVVVAAAVASLSARAGSPAA
ncbi:MAG TPA: hypothetical protein VHF47_11220 [Acidimicrobiales bacterium]|nr:hypothetical protein [Acidimicrobiales bacterium]